MKQIVYISTAVKPMTEEDLINILEVSKSKNHDHQITGLLLYSAGIFIQLIEGQRENVDNIFASILKDQRHENIIKLVDRRAKHRTFPEWSMGFASIPTAICRELVGFINPPDVVFSNDYNPSVVNILKSFLESNNLMDTINKQ
jgi:hypothetical protein